jgi:hypothetical protein
MAMMIRHRTFSYAKKKAVDGGGEEWAPYAMLELSESSIHGPSVRWQLDATDDWTRPHGEWKVEATHNCAGARWHGATSLAQVQRALANATGLEGLLVDVRGPGIDLLRL